MGGMSPQSSAQLGWSQEGGEHAHRVLRGQALRRAFASRALAARKLEARPWGRFWWSEQSEVLCELRALQVESWSGGRGVREKEQDGSEFRAKEGKIGGR